MTARMPRVPTSLSSASFTSCGSHVTKRPRKSFTMILATQVHMRIISISSMPKSNKIHGGRPSTVPSSCASVSCWFWMVTLHPSRGVSAVAPSYYSERKSSKFQFPAVIERLKDLDRNSHSNFQTPLIHDCVLRWTLPPHLSAFKTSELVMLVIFGFYMFLSQGERTALFWQ